MKLSIILFKDGEMILSILNPNHLQKVSLPENPDIIEAIFPLAIYNLDKLDVMMSILKKEHERTLERKRNDIKIKAKAKAKAKGKGQ